MRKSLIREGRTARPRAARTFNPFRFNAVKEPSTSQKNPAGKRELATGHEAPPLVRNHPRLLQLISGAVIFVLDLELPLGVANGVLYVGLVLIGLMARDRRLIIGGALLGSGLTLLGMELSPAGGEMWKVLANRGFAILMLWITATLCLWEDKAQKKLALIHNELERRVRGRTAELNDANYRLKRERAFLQINKDIAVASNAPGDLEETMRYCLRQVCTHAGWPVGHVYLPPAGQPDLLSPTPIWYLENPENFQTFREITENTAFGPGEGLPGRVLSSGKPAWIIDVTQDPNFPRAKLARDIDVKAGFAFPILIGSTVAGVMEFFSAKPAEPDSELLETMANIGTLFGRVLERQRARESQERLLHSLEERVKELTTLYDVAQLVGTASGLDEMFGKIASVLAPGFEHPGQIGVRLRFHEKEHLSGGFRPAPWNLKLPIMIQDSKVGTLEIHCAREPGAGESQDPFLAEERSMVDTVARMLGIATERMQAEEEIKQSHRHLQTLYNRLQIIREEERTRIAREVHDELAQGLTTLKLELTLLIKKLAASHPGYREQSEMMQETIDRTLKSVKKLVMDLRPPILDDLGLGEAIHWQGNDFEKRTGILFHFDNSVGDHPLDEARAITLFRIFQETLTNVARHANARRIHATLSEEEEWVTLTVADDGCGIAPERISHPESLGLLGMQERASAWGGQVAIEGEPGKGTTITIRLKKEAHEHIGQH